MLASRRRGHGERLVLLHGFTQTERSWDRIAEAMARRYEVVTVDAPGHGGSAHADATLAQGAALLARAGGNATYAGYSMGGRLCLHMAIEHPQLVERLILVGTSPGLADPAARRARAVADAGLADRIETIGLEAFLDGWLAQPLFAGLTDDAANRADRSRNDAASLAASLRHAGLGAQESLWDSLAGIRCPVLLVTGANDAKFTAIAAEMASHLPQAEVAVIPDAGHSVHVEQPNRFVAELTRWLDDHPPAASPIDASSP